MSTQSDIIIFDPRPSSRKPERSRTSVPTPRTDAAAAVPAARRASTMPKSSVPTPDSTTVERGGRVSREELSFRRQVRAQARASAREGDAAHVTPRSRVIDGSERRSARRNTSPEQNTGSLFKRGSLRLDEIADAVELSAEEPTGAKSDGLRRSAVPTKRNDAGAPAAEQKAKRKPIQMKEVELFGRKLQVPVPSLPHIPGPHLPHMKQETKRRLALVAIIFAVVVGFLYGPARDLYVAKRDEQVLSARLEQINAENDQLTEALQTLQTREGIEDEARRRGFVSWGETLVHVEGLEGVEGSQSTSGSNNIVGHQNEEEEQPFYITVLDFIFQYKPDA